MSTRSRSDATELEAFIRQCHHALAHQLRGNSGPFLEFWSHADDIVILGAIGRYARGWEDVKTHIQGAAKTLNWTRLAVEPIVTHARQRARGVSHARTDDPWRARRANAPSDAGIPPRGRSLGADSGTRQHGHRRGREPGAIASRCRSHPSLTD